MAIREEERIRSKMYEKLKSTYQQIGKKFYEENKDSEPADAEYAELFAAIKQVEKEQELIEVRKLMMQGKRRCDKCQNIIPLESRFCNMCGEKLEPLTIGEEETDSSAEANVRKCPNCGMQLEADAVFCMNCGTKC